MSISSPGLISQPVHTITGPRVLFKGIHMAAQFSRDVHTAGQVLLGLEILFLVCEAQACVTMRTKSRESLGS